MRLHLYGVPFNLLVEFVFMCVCVDLANNLRTHVCIDIYIYTHVYTYTYLYMYVHALDACI